MASEQAIRRCLGVPLQRFDPAKYRWYNTRSGIIHSYFAIYNFQSQAGPLCLADMV
jgi:hypothetical protein